MASIRKETSIDAPPDKVWDALRDFGAVHERLVPGFVTDCRLEAGVVRVVTFFNGAVAREMLVGVDDGSRRLAYSVVDGPLGSTHHNAAAEVVAEDDGRSRFIWTADVLPDDIAAPMSELMERGIGVIKSTLESETARQAAH